MPSGKVDTYIGNTDKDWFDYLKSRPNLREVNHWQPSGVKFKVLNEGGIFFFRLKAPINKIGGFGLLASTENASISLLWDSLGIANGLTSKAEFLKRVKYYRSKNGVKGFVDEATQVGFKILIEPVFLDEKDWFEVPKDWSPKIVVGKGYSSDTEAGQYLLSKFMQLAGKISSRDNIARQLFGIGEPPKAHFVTRTSKQRTGQNTFKLNLMYAYEGKCAISGCAIEEVLEAAHIQPFSENPDHSIENGILMRKDIHALFDHAAFSIDKNYQVVLSDHFKEKYGSQENYYLEFDGKQISLPKDKVHWPSISALSSRR